MNPEYVKPASKKDLSGLASADLAAWVLDLGGTPAQARMIFGAIHREGIESVSNLPISASLKGVLLESSRISISRGTSTSSEDGSTKFLLKLEDGEEVEAIAMPIRNRLTLCVSSQVGCALDCAFCVTGLLPFKRNLTASEIVGQVHVARKALAPLTITNVVFMGMGEPLLNFEEVRTSISILSDSSGLGIGPRRITVSTAGYIPNLLRVGREMKVNLAVSLTGATDEKRSRFMPLNLRYPIRDLMNAIRQFQTETKRQVLIEYTLIAGETDGDDDADALAAVLQGSGTKLNVIPYNENPFFPYRRSPENRAVAFHQRLIDQGVFTTIRRSRAADIAGACGQLAAGRVLRIPSLEV